MFYPGISEISTTINKKTQLQRKVENENEKFRRESKRQMGEVVHRLPDLIMDIQDKTKIR